VTSLKGKLVQLGIRAAQLGTNVVFDFGFWGKTNDQHSAGSLAPSGRVAKSSTCRLTTKSNAGVSPPHTMLRIAVRTSASWSFTRRGK
jgi:hypothetical protein